MFEKLASLFRAEKAQPEPSDLEFYVSSPATHDAAYRKGTALISPHIWVNGQVKKLTATSSKEMQLGIRYLQAVTTYHPANWNAYWIIGKAHQALGQNQDAYQSFKSAYAIQTENPNVAREYADVCLRLGYGGEAVKLAEAAIQAGPQDAGLRANLALACLIAGDIPRAQATIDDALRMAPGDVISQRVRKVIGEVANGKRRQPKTLVDLQ